jgi:hypothetical protein
MTQALYAHMNNKTIKKKGKTNEPCVVAHTCNPSYLGGGDWENCGSRLCMTKSL